MFKGALPFDEENEGRRPLQFDLHHLEGGDGGHASGEPVTVGAHRDQLNPAGDR